MPASIVPQLNRDFPQRIVCLSDETTETLYLLGEEERIVGVSGFTFRPPAARSKPRISTFKDANVDAVLDLHPDLVLTFSDVQADISRQLILRGLTVLNFNQRSIAEIFQMIATLARLVGRPDRGEVLVDELRAGLLDLAESARAFPSRPRVYFEEWHDPLISGIGWVDELIEIAGGTPLFPELRTQGKAQDRIVDPAEVIERNPEIIFASWCGMQVNSDAIRSRPNWSPISAVQSNRIFEIPSSCILQPGPAALTDGVRLIHAHLAASLGLDPANRRSHTGTANPEPL